MKEAGAMIKKVQKSLLKEGLNDVEIDYNVGIDGSWSWFEVKVNDSVSDVEKTKVCIKDIIKDINPKAEVFTFFKGGS